MRALSVLVALIGVALLATSVADAHRFKYRTTAKLISGGPTGAKGKLGCTTKVCPTRCKAGRKVSLFRDNETGGPDQKFGTAKTNSKGEFTVNAPLIAGQYYVVASVLVFIQNVNHRHSCSAAMSVQMRL